MSIGQRARDTILDITRRLEAIEAALTPNPEGAQCQTINAGGVAAVVETAPTDLVNDVTSLRRDLIVQQGLAGEGDAARGILCAENGETLIRAAQRVMAALTEARTQLAEAVESDAAVRAELRNVELARDHWHAEADAQVVQAGQLAERVKDLEAERVKLQREIDASAWSISPAMAQQTIDRHAARVEALEADLARVPEVVRAATADGMRAGFDLACLWAGREALRFTVGRLNAAIAALGTSAPVAAPVGAVSEADIKIEAHRLYLAGGATLPWGDAGPGVRSAWIVEARRSLSAALGTPTPVEPSMGELARLPPAVCAMCRRLDPCGEREIDRLAEDACDEWEGERGTFQNYRYSADRERWRKFAVYLHGLGARPRPIDGATGQGGCE